MSNLGNAYKYEIKKIDSRYNDTEQIIMSEADTYRLLVEIAKDLKFKLVNESKE